MKTNTPKLYIYKKEEKLLTHSHIHTHTQITTIIYMKTKGCDYFLPVFLGTGLRAEAGVVAEAAGAIEVAVSSPDLICFLAVPM